GKVVAIVVELKPILNFVQIAAGIVVVPFVDGVAIRLLGIFENKVASDSGGSAALAAVDEIVNVAPMIVVQADFLEEDIGGLLRLSGCVGGTGTTRIPGIIEHKVG